MRLAARVLACAVLVAACGTPSPTVEPVTEPIPTTASTPTNAPATDFSSSELCPGGTGNVCRLAAGEHHSLGFGDGIAFTLRHGWTVRANESDVILLEHGDVTDPVVVGLMTGAPRILSWDPGPTPLATTTADDAIRLFESFPDGYGSLAVQRRTSRPLAEGTATVFDVSTNENPVLLSFPVTERWWTLHSGRDARFMWSWWAGAPFIVTLETDSGGVDDLDATVQPILDSLEFGDED
ncbi:MAG TPA: hypothetical protein VJ850_07135 [Candidatus Limnocylindrales bacterium]|nr:hypothetical protein [Candidatus Limnocylindrales bacterium]